MKEAKQNANGGFSRKINKAVATLALRRLAGALCNSTIASDEAGDEILYGLPGVFSMELIASDARVRLIKEARALRVMKKAEKSAVLLRIKLEDLAVVSDITARECTLQKAFSEGRLTFSGKTKYLATVMRASAAGDKLLLTSDEYYELYGKKKED